MTLQIGDTIPSGTLTSVDQSGPTPIGTEEFFHGKKVVVFGVPGAFTPTCSETHLPGFIEHANAIKATGVNTVACITVNDPFVVAAWAQSQNAEEITMLSDGNADYVSALGMSIDMSARGFGTRSARFAMIVENGKITYIAQEPTPKDHTVSAATSVLKQLQKPSQ